MSITDTSDKRTALARALRRAGALYVTVIVSACLTPGPPSGPIQWPDTLDDRWVLVGEAESAVAYVDIESLVITDRATRGWALWAYRESQSQWRGTWDHVRELYEYDCGLRRTRLLRREYYYGADHVDGVNFEAAEERLRPGWSTPAPGTLSETVVRAICDILR